MDHRSRSLYSFDNFTLDAGRARLLRDGEPVNLRPKALDLLLYLVEQHGRVATKDELLRVLWPKVVVTEDSLVKCIQEVRAALGDEQHRYLKTVSRRGYLFDAPVTVAASDESAAVPEPLAAGAAPSADSTSVEARFAPRRVPRLVAAGALAALFAGAIGLYWSTREPLELDPEIPAVKSVAVLPFVSIGDDANQEYFSDGVSEELLNVLANIPGLRVPSRTSSFSFKGSDATLPTIAAALGVEHVLEGSVRKSGASVRITAQLIEVATDSHVWSAVYDRELTDVFVVQDEIARDVARELEIELIGKLPDRSSSRTENLEAHDAYLRGLHHLRSQRSEEILEARADYERAVRLDPEYAAAHAGIAEAALFATTYGILEAEAGYAAAGLSIGRALEIDPGLAEAHRASGRLHFVRGDLEAAAAEYRRAIELGPGLVPPRAGLAFTLDALGQRDEARAALERALELDPLDGFMNWFAGNARLAQGDVAAARAYFQRAVDFVPSQPNSYAGLGDVEIVTGRLDEAIAWYLRGLAQDPGQAHMSAIVGRLYYALGDHERARLWFERAADLLDVAPLQRVFREFEPRLVRVEHADAVLTDLSAIPKPQLEALGPRLFQKTALRAGDVATIEPFFRRNWPELFAVEPNVNATNFAVVPSIAWVAMSSGEQDRASGLLSRALEVTRDTSARTMAPLDWSTVLVETELLALQQRREESLAALRRAIDGGWRMEAWQLENDPTLAGIRSEPGFGAMLAEVGADLAAQLENVRQRERDGLIDGLPPHR